MKTSIARLSVRMDGVVNLVGAVALFAAGPVWASALGIDSVWPIAAVGVIFAVNGVECLLVTRPERMSPVPLRAVGMIDFLVAIPALGVALVDPTDATTAARWVLALLAGAAMVMGIVKIAEARRLTADGVAGLTTAESPG